MERFADCTTQLKRLEWYRAAAQRYVAAVNAGDLEAVLALYADNAEVHDPVFERGFLGKRALRLFYEGVVGRAKLEIVGRIRGSPGNAIATPVVARVPGVEIEVITVTRFDDQGLIQRYEAYWGPDDVKQVEDRAP